MYSVALELSVLILTLIEYLQSLIASEAVNSSSYLFSSSALTAINPSWRDSGSIDSIRSFATFMHVPIYYVRDVDRLTRVPNPVSYRRYTAPQRASKQGKEVR